MLDRSKVMAQTKGDTLVLQAGGGATGRLPVLVKNENSCEVSREDGVTEYRENME